MINNGQFWLNKKVFITGHTGFKGGWLSLWLTLMGAKVTGFALPPNTIPSMYSLADIESTIFFSQLGDIRDYQSLKSAMIAAAPDVVFHLAAQPLVKYSYQNPIETYQTNVMGTAHVLEAMRNIETIRAALIITTDKCYENNDKQTAYNEMDPMGGFDPYSSSKGCAELVVSAYQRSFFSKQNPPLAVATARAGNVIGGGDWSADRLLPDAFKAFDAGKPLLIRNLNAIRPWQHVLEPLAGYLLLAQKLFESGSVYVGGWNFGPDSRSEKPVSEVIELLTRMWGPTAKWQQDGTFHAHEASSLKLDCSKANSCLGWLPQWTLEVALQKTVDWQNAVKANINMNKFSLAQIIEYQLQYQSGKAI